MVRSNHDEVCCVFASLCSTCCPPPGYYKFLSVCEMRVKCFKWFALPTHQFSLETWKVPPVPSESSVTWWHSWAVGAGSCQSQSQRQTNYDRHMITSLPTKYSDFIQSYAYYSCQLENIEWQNRWKKCVVIILGKCIFQCWSVQPHQIYQDILHCPLAQCPSVNRN